jgi:hypothetical protein
MAGADQPTGGSIGIPFRYCSWSGSLFPAGRADAAQLKLLVGGVMDEPIKKVGDPNAAAIMESQTRSCAGAQNDCEYSQAAGYRRVWVSALPSSYI